MKLEEIQKERKRKRERKRGRKKGIMLTGDTVSEKSLSSNCIDTPDSCSNSGIRYKISGICPELTSVPLFDLRELLNLKTTLERKWEGERGEREKMRA